MAHAQSDPTAFVPTRERGREARGRGFESCPRSIRRAGVSHGGRPARFRWRFDSQQSLLCRYQPSSSGHPRRNWTAVQAHHVGGHAIGSRPCTRAERSVDAQRPSTTSRSASEISSVGLGLEPGGFDDLIAAKQTRYGTVEEVASAAVFLASDLAAWCNGTTLVLDGGFTSSLL
jgi:hypothetical protein